MRRRLTRQFAKILPCQLCFRIEGPPGMRPVTWQVMDRRPDVDLRDLGDWSDVRDDCEWQTLQARVSNTYGEGAVGEPACRDGQAVARGEETLRRKCYVESLASMGKQRVRSVEARVLATPHRMEARSARMWLAAQSGCRTEHHNRSRPAWHPDHRRLALADSQHLRPGRRCHLAKQERVVLDGLVAAVSPFNLRARGDGHAVPWKPFRPQAACVVASGDDRAPLFCESIETLSDGQWGSRNA